MGIAGLLPILKSIHKSRHIRDWAGKTVGVDAYGWLHKGVISCAIELATGKPTTKYVDYAMNKVRMLRHFGVTPYLVFDGDHLPSKAATEIERARRREQSREKGLGLLKLGKRSQAYVELQKSIDVTPTMARHLIDACKSVGVQCIVAPYEADAQMYYLEKMGIIDAILSEDSDLLVFGAHCLVTKLDQYGECVEINRADLGSNKEVSLAGWTDTDFRHMCILSGCDYLENIPSMGLKTAHRFMKRHKDIEKVLRAVRFDGKMRVPDGYLEAFRRADLTFQHQRVFCPINNCLVMCNEPDSPLDDKYLVYIGPETDLEVARGVACGDLDPSTKEPIVIKAAPTTKPSVMWGRPQNPAPPEKNNQSITSFFKPQQAPRTPLQPVSGNVLSASKPAGSKLEPASLKRSLPWTSLVPKRPRIDPLEPQPMGQVIETGERSAFFRTQSRKFSTSKTPSPPSSRSALKGQTSRILTKQGNLTEGVDFIPESPPTTHKGADTPVNQQEPPPVLNFKPALETPARLATASLLSPPESMPKKAVSRLEGFNPTSEEAASAVNADSLPPTPTPTPARQVDAVGAVKEGWKSAYKTPPAYSTNPSLANLIEKLRHEPARPLPPMTLQRTMSAGSRFAGRLKHDFKPPLKTRAKTTQIPHTVPLDDSSQSQGESQGSLGASQSTAEKTQESREDEEVGPSARIARFAYAPQT